jgi:hypothetical protein
MPEPMKRFFNEMILDLESDKDQIEKDGEFLIKKKNNLKSAKEQLNGVIYDIEGHENNIENSLKMMQNKVEQMNNDTIDENSIGRFFSYSKKNGERMLEIESDLKGNLETQYTMMEVFEEREDDSDKYLKLMNRLWNKEWDLKLQRKYIIDKRAY